MRDIVNDLNAPLYEKHARKILSQMLMAINHCHEKNIIHRDVKLENFLIKKTNPNDFVIKLTDFGIACLYDEENKPSRRCGTTIALPPEIIRGSQYTPKIDCWAIGVIMYELLSNELPFYSKDNDQLFIKILKKPISFKQKAWDNVSLEGKDLVTRLLHKDPAKRLTAAEAL